MFRKTPLTNFGGVPNLLITSVKIPVVHIGKGDCRGLVATDLKHYSGADLGEDGVQGFCPHSPLPQH
jgi:hypothetical protein